MPTYGMAWMGVRFPGLKSQYAPEHYYEAKLI